uniref:Uncharacterized protein n=1 Tax=Panagrolaimus sp. ES5 TaxID=591445 RepID=A0AC34FLT4_9BILA
MDNHHTGFERKFYNKYFTKDQELIEFIKDSCILDSDFLLDSIADFLLGKMKKMNWKKMQTYLGLEDDFTEVERKLIDENQLEYFLSINFAHLKFPFENKNLYSIKPKFLSPLNVLLARIVARSDEESACSLSLINKTMKNESDRNPLKLIEFHARENTWVLKAAFKRNWIPRFLLHNDKCDLKYFECIKNRKVIAKEFSILSNVSVKSDETCFRCLPFDFTIQKKGSELRVVSERSSDLLYHFDVKSCPLQSIDFMFYNLKGYEKTFEEYYNHLIAKDLSKKIV